MEHIVLTSETTPSAVRRVSAILEAGGLVIYPTDTAYGIAVNASNQKAVQNIFLLKERREYKTLTVCVASLEQASLYIAITPLAQKLQSIFLPGPLTLVVEKRSNRTPAFAHGVGDEASIGVRIPDHSFCTQLSGAVDFPYTATSANKSGTEVTSLEGILKQFSGEESLIDLVVEDKNLLTLKHPPQASTIVDVRGIEPVIIRGGVVSSEDIFNALV